jgi:hypothetical protein
MPNVRFLASLVLVPALALAACSGSGGGQEQRPPARPAAADSPENLAGVCPKNVVILQDWEPEAEHAAGYQLIGPGSTVDSEKKRVKGPLVIDGVNTGVDIEMRAGGPAIGYQSVASQMYVDPEITLGAANTDAAVATSADQRVVSVVAPLTKSPQMLMWDPASHPDWKGIADIGKTDAKVVVSSHGFFAPLLVNKGLIKQSQVDLSYDGSPARFVASPDIVQQGFVTAEPHVYEREVQAWMRPVKYQLLPDVGYNAYPEALSVRADKLEQMSPCLKKLVPILQRAQRDYLADPGRTNKLIVDVVRQYNDGWTYSQEVADYAAKTMRDLRIVANDSSGPLGGTDMNRVQSSIDTFTPILKSSGAKVKEGLRADDIATDKFIDPTITLK